MAESPSYAAFSLLLQKLFSLIYEKKKAGESPAHEKGEFEQKLARRVGARVQTYAVVLVGEFLVSTSAEHPKNISLRINLNSTNSSLIYTANFLSSLF